MLLTLWQKRQRKDKKELFNSSSSTLLKTIKVNTSSIGIWLLKLSLLDNELFSKFDINNRMQ